MRHPRWWSRHAHATDHRRTPQGTGVPVLGRPFAELQLEWLAREGIDHVIYSIGYMGEMIRAALGSRNRFSVRIDFVDEGTDLRARVALCA